MTTPTFFYILSLSMLLGWHFFPTCAAFAVENEVEVELYLQKFGYLGNTGYRTGALIGSDAVYNALKDFQRFAGINQTGVIDNATLIMMNTPRCGVKDHPDDERPHHRSKRYVLEGSKWKKRHLTYKISKYPKKLKDVKVVKEIERAFEMWSNVTLLTFERRLRGRVDIDIAFESRAHGDQEPFDGPGNTLAHASFPQYGGDVHFDDEEKWTINDVTGVDLLQVATHEIGHSLGLLHSDEKRAIMAPYYRGARSSVKLHDDDIEGIQAIYGPRQPNTTPVHETPTGPPPDTSQASDLCENPTIDTITRTQNGSTYAFRGDFYWKLLAESIADGYPRKISDDWKGLEGNLDASLTWSNGKTYFFKGGRYWRFTNKELDAGYPKLLSVGFEGVPDMLDAAFVWSGNGKTYFFKGDQYWRYDSNNDQPVSDKYPKPISTWTGLPNNIDAALQYENGRTYFFKGDKYYRFNDIDFKVDSGDPPFPRSTSKWWFGCKLNSEMADISETSTFTLALVLRDNNTVIRIDSGSGPVHH